MKNTIKVALGFAVGGVLILLNQLSKKKTESKKFITSEGNQYPKDQMYRNSQGDIFKNGKKLHFAIPQLLSEANNKVEAHIAKNARSKDQISYSRNFDYHKKGIRHH